jgi:hypothetical protein
VAYLQAGRWTLDEGRRTLDETSNVLPWGPTQTQLFQILR